MIQQRIHSGFGDALKDSQLRAAREHYAKAMLGRLALGARITGGLQSASETHSDGNPPRRLS